MLVLCVLKYLQKSLYLKSQSFRLKISSSNTYYKFKIEFHIDITNLVGAHLHYSYSI